MDGQSLTLGVSVGVISGLFTAVLLWFVHQIWFKVVSPWLEQNAYKGVYVDGTWNSVIKSNLSPVGPIQKYNVRHLTLNLFQKGNAVRGSFYAKAEYFDRTANGTDILTREYANQYAVKGEVVNNYLILNYKALSRQRTGLGALVFQVTHGGIELNGGISFVGEGNVEAINTLSVVEFKRTT